MWKSTRIYTSTHLVERHSSRLLIVNNDYRRALKSENVYGSLNRGRYSLLLEGFRWVDARRYGRLNTLPLDLPGHFVARVVPIPKAECDVRDTKPNGC